MATTKRSRSATAKSPRRSAAKKTSRTASRRRSAPARKRTGRGANPDAIALIKADHKAVNDLFRTYQGLGDRAYKRKRQIADKIIKELSVHATIEEQILYPAARKLSDGKPLVEEAKKEHQQLKKALARLDKLDADDERFDATMREIRDEVRHHVREEEASEGILGRMRAQIDRDELRKMAKALRAAKKAAPTRPHPKAPNEPPGNVLAGAPAALIDKARDLISGRS